MRIRSRRLRVAIGFGLVVTTGMLFAGSGLACASMALDEAQTVVDFCFLFPCDRGAFGGLIKFCNEAGGTVSPLLEDCPEETTQ